VTVANFYERLITYRTLNTGFYARYDRWLADRRRTEKAEPNRELWLAVVFARAPSATIKTTANAKMSVACPATRRDGRRRLRLRNKEAKVSLQTSSLQNFKLETSKVRNFKLQTWVFKLRKWESSNLSLQTSKVRNFKLQTWVFKLRKWESSNLSLQS